MENSGRSDGSTPLALTGIHNIRLVSWGSLQPGMVILHLVVDCSHSMESAGELETALEYFFIVSLNNNV